MKVKILSCWFTTSYGTYTDGLRRALERLFGSEVGVIASNCGCGDPMEVGRRFVDQRCEFVEFVNVPYYKKSNALKEWLMVQARQLVYRERARRYIKLTGEADVLHFQQILNAFGSVSVFNWLSMPCSAARVVTVHELDPYQLQHPELSVRYNQADALIVLTEAMRSELISQGVRSHLIHVVPHGVELRTVSDLPREGIVFYLGHKLNQAKGLPTLLTALALLKKELQGQLPLLTIHGHYGAPAPEEGVRWVEAAGLSGSVRWLNEISFDSAVDLYQRSLLCVLPYTGSFAGYPATLALANGAVVIGTRAAGLPEHLGEAGVWVEPTDPPGLAAAMLRLLTDEAERRRIAALGRARAEHELSWDAVAQKTRQVYAAALRNRQDPVHAAVH